MGWSGGTEVFDLVAEELLHISYKAFDSDLPTYRVLNVLSALKAKLEDQDWDTLNESNYWEHPKIGELLGNTNLTGEKDE